MSDEQKEEQQTDQDTVVHDLRSRQVQKSLSTVLEKEKHKKSHASHVLRKYTFRNATVDGYITGRRAM